MAAKELYQILELDENADLREVKTAYRRLSMQFHPDKTGNDPCMAEKFSRIKEAYEILTAKHFHKSKHFSDKQPRSGTFPIIHFFKTDKNSFEYNEEITFSWKTENATKIVLKPFGEVPAEGSKKYNIRDFRSPVLAFELSAENIGTGEQVHAYQSLRNRTFDELQTYFRIRFSSEQERLHHHKSDSRMKNKKNVQVPKWVFWLFLAAIIFLAMSQIIMLWF